MKAKEIILNFIKKYKIESISVLIFSLIYAYIFDSKFDNNNVTEVLIIISFVAIGSFLVDKIFLLYENYIKQFIKEKCINIKLNDDDNKFIITKTVAYVLVVLIQYLLYRLSLHILIYNDIHETSRVFLSALSVNIIFTSLISYFTIKEKGININNFLLKLFMNYLFLFLIVCVVLAGIYILYIIFELLIGEIPYKIIIKIIVFIMTLILSLGYFVFIGNVAKKIRFIKKLFKEEII